MNEWPKTIQIDGRTYEIHPQMPTDEFMEIVQTFANEGEKMVELCEAMGMDIDL